MKYPITNTGNKTDLIPDSLSQKVHKPNPPKTKTITPKIAHSLNPKNPPKIAPKINPQEILLKKDQTIHENSRKYGISIQLI